MRKRLKDTLKNAFALEAPGFEFTEEDAKVADKLAYFLVKRRLTAPAIVFVKSSAPLNMIASQLLTFFKPFANAIFNLEEYKRFAEILEHRESLEFLVKRIEEAQRKHDELKETKANDIAGK